VRSKITVAADASEDVIREAALADTKIIENTQDKNVIKIIVVKGRIVNIVVK